MARFASLRHHHQSHAADAACFWAAGRRKHPVDAGRSVAASAWAVPRDPSTILVLTVNDSQKAR